MRAFISIRLRLMAATALLILTVLGAVSWLWATTERDLIRSQFLTEQAKALVSGMAKTTWGLLAENNWGQLRMNLDLMMREHPEFVYIFVSDDRQDGQIRAASPPDLVDDFIPDVVPSDVTHAQMLASESARSVDTYLLRDVEFPAGSSRGRRGDRIIEVAADVKLLDGVRHGTIRIGLSTAKADSAVKAAMLRVLAVGVLGLLAGLLGAVLLAGRLSDPVRRLQASATRIAAGDFVHRADVRSADEIGALAEAFNQMTAALERSFAKLRATLTSFERFVPRKFLQVVAPEGLENIVVGTSTTKHVTILFSDIRGYTTISETSTPKEIFDMLNEYLGEMGDAIDNHGGFIDKYIGDAIMALFDDEHTDEALAAALAMRARLRELNVRRVERGQKPIDNGIGMHCGDVEMGTIGFSAKVESTVIGDPVNVASRIEGLTKGYGVGILVTGAVVEALRDRSRFEVVLVDANAKVKGKGEAIAVYEVREAVANAESRVDRPQ